MRYMLMVFGEEADLEAVPAEEMEASVAAYEAFFEEMGQRGVMRASERLQHVDTATTVRVRNGKTLATDGPFIETKEQLGGFYIVDCKDLDEAIEVAAKIPGASEGAIEVRPIWE